MSQEVDVSRNVFNPTVYRGISGFEQMVSAIDDSWDEFREVSRRVILGGRFHA